MALDNRAWSEKRNFIRMKINTPVRVQHSSATFVARCKDLSGSGMLVECEQALPLGSIVELFIDQEGDKRVPFHATAEVARVDPAVDGHFTLGLSITSIKD
ncbi:MAG: PilZ domain-containing protein [Spongiibacteraceae bacterium]